LHVIAAMNIGPEKTRRTKRTLEAARAPAKPQAVPLEERYGRVPPELAGLDREELPFGDDQEQLAAHGPEGDANITTEGADVSGIALSEPSEALEDLQEITEEDLARAPETD
jgi:hypothetical protein